MNTCELYIKMFFRDFPGSPVVRRTSPSNAGGAGSVPGRGAKIPHASGPKNQNIKQKQYCNKFNKDFKNGPHQKNLFKEMLFKKELRDSVLHLDILLAFSRPHWNVNFTRAGILVCFIHGFVPRTEKNLGI